MTKRPLNDRFNNYVKAEIKITTIRDKPWPLGVPIMLYNWSGKPYRSKQIDVEPVIARGHSPITISRDGEGAMSYHTLARLPRMLWQCEGFNSQEDMDAWFSAKMKPGTSSEKHIMLFRLHPSS